jgi:hypothetical protein
MAGKVLIGGNLVVASGSIIIPHGLEASITPIPIGAAPLTFRFAFTGDGGAPSYRIEPISGGILNPLTNAFRVSLINFDNSLGQAVTAPIAVGTIANRQLSLIFAAYLIGQPHAAVRILHYTFTLAGEQDV